MGKSKGSVDRRRKIPLTEEEQKKRDKIVRNVIAAACEAFGVTEQGLMFGQTRRLTAPRQAAMLFLRDRQGFRLDDIAEVFTKDRATIILSVDRFVILMAMSGALRSKYLDLYANFYIYEKQEKADVSSQQVINRTTEVRE